MVDGTPLTRTRGAGPVDPCITIGQAGTPAVLLPRPTDDIHARCDRRRGPSEAEAPRSWTRSRGATKSRAWSSSPPVGGPLPALAPCDLEGGPDKAVHRKPCPEKPSFAAPFRTPRVSAGAGSPKECLCLALRIDSDHAKAINETSIPSFAISVKQLGGHDTTFHYTKRHLEVNHNGCVWQVWLNVLAHPVEGPGNQMPRLFKDQDGCWRVEESSPTPEWAQDYQDFC